MSDYRRGYEKVLKVAGLTRAAQRMEQISGWPYKYIAPDSILRKGEQEPLTIYDQFRASAAKTLTQLMSPLRVPANLERVVKGRNASVGWHPRDREGALIQTQMQAIRDLGAAAGTGVGGYHLLDRITSDDL